MKKTKERVTSKQMVYRVTRKRSTDVGLATNIRSLASISVVDGKVYVPEGYDRKKFGTVCEHDMFYNYKTKQWDKVDATDIGRPYDEFEVLICRLECFNSRCHMIKDRCTIKK